MTLPEQRVALWAIYKVFFSIGVMSFGGGLVPWMQREIVTLRGWMKDEDFLPGVALSQILPGVNSTNLAVFIGQKLRGLAGSAVALAGMLTGPFSGDDRSHRDLSGDSSTYQAVADRHDRRRRRRHRHDPAHRSSGAVQPSITSACLVPISRHDRDIRR
jgi:hypothetical protein